MVLSNAAYIDLYKEDDLIKRYYPRRDLYKHLPNPPFIIDTFIGENLSRLLSFRQKTGELSVNYLILRL
ncbi:MAG: hypothetical protein ACOX3C_01685 [Bacilli bacterium]